MSRIDFELPERYVFSVDLPLRVADMNYGNHLGNDRVLTLAQEVRALWLASHGLSELDVEGTGLVLAAAVVVFRAEAHFGTVLRGELGVGDVRTRAFELLHRFTDRETHREIARVKTSVLCLDAQRKVVTLPARLRAALGPRPSG